jgi:hypothetical protein
MYIVMAWYSVKHRDNFTFTLQIGLSLGTVNFTITAGKTRLFQAALPPGQKVMYFSVQQQEKVKLHF